MNQSHTNNPATVLRIARILWAAMLVGCIVFTVVMCATLDMERTVHPTPTGPTLLLFISVAIAVIAVPLAFIARGQAFKRGWVGDVVTPSVFLQGTILSCAICEGAFFVTLPLTLFGAPSLPLRIAPAISFIGLLLLWPNGRAMFPLRSKPDDNPYHFKQ